MVLFFRVMANHDMGKSVTRLMWLKLDTEVSKTFLLEISLLLAEAFTNLLQQSMYRQE